jgi:hypothetical protein
MVFQYITRHVAQWPGYISQINCTIEPGFLPEPHLKPAILKKPPVQNPGPQNRSLPNYFLCRAKPRRLPGRVAWRQKNDWPGGGGTRPVGERRKWYMNFD